MEFAGSILRSIEADYPDRLVVESETQDIRDIYTETHLILAHVLMHTLGDRGDFDHLKLAEQRLRLWLELRTETPFNNFANCLSLLILRRTGLAGSSLLSDLQAVCRAQKLDSVRPAAGNNILLMKMATDAIIRPVCLDKRSDPQVVEELLNQLDRWRGEDGLYFDWPRREGEVRLYPPNLLP